MSPGNQKRRNAFLNRLSRGKRMRLAALLARADQARDAKEWVKAVALYRSYLKKKSRDAGIWVQLGHSLKESGQRPEAERAYRQSLALAPDTPDTHLQLGHLLKITGRQAEALKSYARAAMLDPHHPDAAREMRGLQQQSVAAVTTIDETRLHELASRIDSLSHQLAHILTHVTTTKALAFEVSRIKRRMDHLEQVLHQQQSSIPDHAAS